MQKLNAVYQYIIPDYFLGALYYNDISALNDKEINQLNNFENYLILEGKQKNCSHYNINVTSKEPYFSWYNSINYIGGDVVNIEVIYFLNDPIFEEVKQ
jgi:hypothetical protein